ncbi:uncharacterized protein LOC143449531 [Clavelina lepadiformis]|uniref:uncharacterized protein LOC143449531 n=1 Tax=Clavelina lepadiformis TaxID=159417 RepID=UPI004040EB42
MKVICAGLSKTGTKTLQAALKEIGYNVYDHLENCLYLNKEWTKIITEGGTTEDFRRMFENVDAVTDIPGCYFWDEIHKAFPEAKIILTMRDDEDTWARSMYNQVAAANNPQIQILYMLSPTLKQARAWSDKVVTAAFGTKLKESFFGPATFNMLLARMTYRRHNAHVLQNAPKDKLLVYNVKEGWEPLCKFLEVDVPSVPFPCKNVRGKVVKDFLKEDPLAIRAKKEMLVSITLLALLFSFGAYKFSRSWSSKWFFNISSSVWHSFSSFRNKFC